MNAGDTAVRRAGRGRAAVLAAAAAVGLSAWAWFGWGRPNVFPENFGVVEEGKIYRSAALTPGALERVHERYGVKTIVDLGGFDKDPVGDRVASRTAAALGMERYVFLLEGDGTGNPNAYVAALQVINDPSKQPVLVHCSAGAQRTSGCVMLYRDFVQGRPLDETYPEASEYRHDPARNPDLMPYLKKHEAEIRAAYERGKAGGGAAGVPGFPEVKVEPVRP